MIIYNRTSDILTLLNILDSSGNIVYIKLKPYYQILSYTSDSRTEIDLTKFVDSSNYIKYTGQDIAALTDGQIKYKVNLSDNDPAFNDGKYDYTKLICSAAYFTNESTIDASYVKWGTGIIGNIQEQTDLIDLINSKDETFVNKVTFDASLSDLEKKIGDPSALNEYKQIVDASLKLIDKHIDASIAHVEEEIKGFVVDEEDPIWNAEKVNYVTKKELDSSISGFKNITYLTLSEYDEIEVKDPSIIYIITDAENKYATLTDITTINSSISDISTRLNTGLKNVLDVSLVTALPTGYGDANTIYKILKDNDSQSSIEYNNYNYYTWTSKNHYDLIGNPEQDLTDYVTTDYLTSNYYNNTTVNLLISKIKSFNVLIVSELPAKPNTNTIYFLPKATAETQDVYDEYMYINSAWEKIGTTEIDLSEYAKKEDVNSSLGNYYTKTEIDDKGYLTEIPDEYVTESELNSSLGDYYTKTEIDGKGYLTEIPSEYVTETELDNKGYLTEEKEPGWNAAKDTYLTEIPAEYVTETELNTSLGSYVQNSSFNSSIGDLQTQVDHLIWEGTQEAYDALEDKTIYKIYAIKE